MHEQEKYIVTAMKKKQVGVVITGLAPVMTMTRYATTNLAILTLTCI